MKLKTPLRTENIGLAGELLVCTEFVRRGFEAIVNPFPGSASDVLVVLPSNRVLRVQVKAVRHLTPYQVRDTVKNRYHFRFRDVRLLNRYQRAGVDFFALVALDEMAVVFLTLPEARRRGMSVTYSKNSFLKHAANSIDNLIKKVK